MSNKTTCACCGGQLIKCDGCGYGPSDAVSNKEISKVLEKVLKMAINNNKILKVFMDGEMAEHENSKASRGELL